MMIKSFLYRNFPRISIKLRDVNRYGYEPEMKILSIIPHSGLTAIDVGAHLGNWTFKMSKVFSSVYSFEPNIFLSDLLERSGLDNVIVQNIALSSNSGFSELRLPIVNEIVRFGNGSLNPITDFIFDRQITQAVKLSTLDSYNLTNIGIIKIDVEGHELNVLKGGLNTIKQSKPIMVIEINNNEIETIKKILNLFDKFAYKPYIMGRGNKMFPWMPGDISKSSNYIFISGNSSWQHN